MPLLHWLGGKILDNGGKQAPIFDTTFGFISGIGRLPPATSPLRVARTNGILRDNGSKLNSNHDHLLLPCSDIVALRVTDPPY